MNTLHGLPTRLSFGRHRGRPLRDVPTEYLAWVIRRYGGPMDQDVRHAVETEFLRRVAHEPGERGQKARWLLDPSTMPAPRVIRFITT